MMLRKIEAMHYRYGQVNEHCRDCSHFIKGRYHDSILRKCKAYGMTHSEASDWAGKYLACGLFNQPLPEHHRPVIETKRYDAEPAEPEKPLDGQIDLFDKEAADA